MEIYREGFKIKDYDIIGFDLDNTLARYRIRNMANSEYLIMARFLVDKKFYPSRHLNKSFEEGTDFLIKGLFLDLENGNVLKVDAVGKIVKAYHGIYPLNHEQIVNIYGPKCYWRIFDMYLKNPLSCWNGPLTSLVRALLDYFDIAVSLIFARLITTIEEKNSEDGCITYSKSQMWRDVCESLTYMFTYEHYAQNKGEYFPKLKKSPELYYYPCKPKVIDWLRQLRKTNKLMVLISGSDSDFVSHTASHTLGENWTELFDLVVCFAKKPGFFSGEQRPFMRRDFASQLIYDTSKISAAHLVKGGVYANGNWQGVLEFARRETGIAEPRALYFGDNMIQDVVVPNLCAGIDVVAIVEELAGENHPDKELIMSKVWGNYMGASQATELPSLWAFWLKKHACLAISGMEILADLPIDHVFVKDKRAGEHGA